ncbi:membrane protein insertase YidC [bacterium]|nr:membrane protein insertase YidC [bacterium]
MEKRLILAIVLSFVVLFLYQALFVKNPPPPQPSEEATSPQKSPPQAPLTEPSAEKVQKEPQKKKETFEKITEENENQIVVDTALYRAVWSNKGAVLLSWKLKKHQDDEGENLQLVPNESEKLGKYPFSLRTEDESFNQLANNSLYQFSRHQIELTQDQSQKIRFLYSDSEGNQVEKIFTFHNGRYSLDIQLNVYKEGQKIHPHLVWGPGFGNRPPETKNQRFGGKIGAAVRSGNKVHRHQEKKFNPEKNTYNFVQWAAYEDNYFAALFLTSPQKSSATFLKQQENENNPHFFLSANYPQKAFIGPKKLETLNQFGYKANKLINFGFFGWIAEILLQAINKVHDSVPNWGFSIIILTFIIKLIFFPLTYSSTRSMAKMQELQPKIKALRSKYKKSKKDIAQRRKMNEEMMKLYKEHGVNPAGGCLPLLIQIPIFWGFFRMLVASVEFRDSPFILWIQDLSTKDPLYITPILMGASQFVQQKMTPTSADPTQQKMMLIMPVILTIFFMNFQSGLVLYWLTNNVLQIGQQYIMNKLRRKKKSQSNGKRRKK